MRDFSLQDLPVIILSTSSGMDAVKKVFRDAAYYYICKPADFSQLQNVIYKALTLVTQKNHILPLENNFMITGASTTIPVIE